MAYLLLYIIKTTVCLIIFYLFFKAFLSHETFFRFNRRLLVFGTVVCFILPAIRMQVEMPSTIQAPFLVMEEVFTGMDTIEPLNESIVFMQPDEYPAQQSFSLSFAAICILIYIVGLLIQLLVLIRSFLSMYKVIRSSTGINYQGCRLMLVDGNIAPFSWYKYIILSKEDYEHNPEEIVTHELAHIRHKHSFDLLLFELSVLLQWFNPAIWLLKKELKDIHEYQADMCVIQSGIDATRYQLLLVKKAVGSSSYTLANSFNHSKLKKRITMMLKEKSIGRAKWKLALLFPALCFMLLAFAKPGNLMVMNQLTSDEVMEKSEEPEKYSREYFKSELDLFMKACSERTDAQEVFEIKNMYLLVNSEGRMLFRNEFLLFNDIESTLSPALFKEKLDSNAYKMLTVISDDATEAADLDKIFGAIRQTFLKNEGMPDSNKVYVRIGDPKEFGNWKMN